MRLHRDDAPGQDEPAEGWVEANRQPTQILPPLRWRVTRSWVIEAPTAAVAASVATGEPEEVRVRRDQLFSQPLFTADELDVLADGVEAVRTRYRELLRDAPDESARAQIRHQLAVAGSLATLLSEERYALPSSSWRHPRPRFRPRRP